MKVNNFLAKGAIYFISSALSRGLPILIVPLLVQLVSSADFGRWAIYQVFIIFSSAGISLSLVSKINREFFLKEKKNNSKAVTHAIRISIALGIFVILLWCIVSLFIPTFLGIPTLWYLLLGVIGISDAIHQIVLNIYRNEGLEIKYGLFEIGKVVCYLLALYLLVYVYDFGWKGLIGAWTIGSLTIGIFSFIAIVKKKYLYLDFDSSEVKSLIIFSFPLVWNLLGGSIIGLSNRLFIKHHLGESQVAYFVIGYTLSMGLILVSESFNKVWSPWFYKRIYDANTKMKEQIVRYSYGFIFVLMLVSICSFFFSKYVIIYLLPEEYTDSISILIYITCALFLNAVSTLLLPYFIAAGKTKILGQIVIFVALINVLANAILVPIYGINGAAVATLISFSLKIILMFGFYQIKSVFPMPWKIRNLSLK